MIILCKRSSIIQILLASSSVWVQNKCAIIFRVGFYLVLKLNRISIREEINVVFIRLCHHLRNHRHIAYISIDLCIGKFWFLQWYKWFDYLWTSNTVRTLILFWICFTILIFKFYSLFLGYFWEEWLLIKIFCWSQDRPADVGLSLVFLKGTRQTPLPVIWMIVITINAWWISLSSDNMLLWFLITWRVICFACHLVQLLVHRFVSCNTCLK